MGCCVMHVVVLCTSLCCAPRCVVHVAAGVYEKGCFVVHVVVLCTLLRVFIKWVVVLCTLLCYTTKTCLINITNFFP